MGGDVAREEIFGRLLSLHEVVPPRDDADRRDRRADRNLPDPRAGHRENVDVEIYELRFRIPLRHEFLVQVCQ